MQPSAKKVHVMFHRHILRVLALACVLCAFLATVQPATAQLLEPVRDGQSGRTFAFKVKQDARRAGNVPGAGAAAGPGAAMGARTGAVTAATSARGQATGQPPAASIDAARIADAFIAANLGP